MREHDRTASQLGNQDALSAEQSQKPETTGSAHDVPRLDWRAFMSASPETPAKTIKALDNYFSHFVAVEVKEEDGKRVFGGQKCVGCGEALSGIFGTWRWGIAHGVGECGKCGWPSHGHHFIKDEAGEDVVTLRNFVLQIHPDFVERRAKAGAA